MRARKSCTPRTRRPSRLALKGDPGEVGSRTDPNPIVLCVSRAVCVHSPTRDASQRSWNSSWFPLTTRLLALGFEAGGAGLRTVCSYAADVLAGRLGAVVPLR